MMRYRNLGTPRELCCCLPTPYRIPKPVAGLAFNFSLIEVAAVSRQLKGAADRGPASSAQGIERKLFSLGVPGFATT
jgi:hypothetical protein